MGRKSFTAFMSVNQIAYVALDGAVGPMGCREVARSIAVKLEHHDSIGRIVHEFDPNGYSTVMVEANEVEYGDWAKVKLPFGTWLGTIRVVDGRTVIRVWVPAVEKLPHPSDKSFTEEEYWENYDRLRISAENMYKRRAEEMLREAAESMSLPDVAEVC